MPSSAFLLALRALLATTIGLWMPVAMAASMGESDARHLLARTGFGPTTTEVRTYAALSRDDAIAKDPAMVIYLDNAQNRKGAANENFAREVMELFTLGQGHYTEQDIKEAARAFTGWGVDRDTGTFAFRPRLHDDGEKTVFGKTGDFDGDAVLDLILERPETAEFIVDKLWR